MWGAVDIQWHKYRGDEQSGTVHVHEYVYVHKYVRTYVHTMVSLSIVQCTRVAFIEDFGFIFHNHFKQTAPLLIEWVPVAAYSICWIEVKFVSLLAHSIRSLT